MLHDKIVDAATIKVMAAERAIPALQKLSPTSGFVHIPRKNGL
jgi:hypothetical protein